MEWKDTSSPRFSTSVSLPTCWTIEDPEKLLRVVVVYGNIHAPGYWCFHCAALGFDTVILTQVAQSIDAADKAKAEAIRCVLARLRSMSGAAIAMAQATPLSGLYSSHSSHSG